MNLQNFASAMRSKPTDAESLMWYYLKDRRLKGFKFRRQVPIGPYIADFVCQQKSLIVECDGGQHNLHEEKIADQSRTMFLQQRGYAVIRFWNHEIIYKTYSVLSEILKYLSPSPSLRSTSPAEGRGEKLRFTKVGKTC